AGYGVLRTVGAYYKWRTGRDGLGQGDAKLVAAAGAWLGWMSLPYVMLAASLLGLIFAAIRWLMGRESLKKPIPFGPFIAAGFGGFWLFGVMPV
ncbi:MAG: A24 family peptidase, partial [Pseudomonadota bacterium]